MIPLAPFPISENTLFEPTIEYVTQSRGSTSVTELLSMHANVSSKSATEVLMLRNSLQQSVVEAAQGWIGELKAQISANHGALLTQDKMKEVVRRVGNLESSMKFVAQYFQSLEKHFKNLSDFLPECDIDGEGEVSFEWYGRKGVRLVTTVGANGLLHWAEVTLNSQKHGVEPVQSLRTIQNIATMLQDIYNDKFNG